MNKEPKKTRTHSKILAVIAIIAFTISAVYIGQSFGSESIEKTIVTTTKNQKKLDDTEQFSINNIFTFDTLDFTFELPEGVTIIMDEQMATGPYRLVTFSDGTWVQMTSNFEFDDEFGSFPNNSPTERIGNYEFYKDTSNENFIRYGIEKDNARYIIHQKPESIIDVASLGFVSKEEGDLDQKIYFQKQLISEFISRFSGNASEITIEEFNSKTSNKKNDLVDFLEPISPFIPRECPFVKNDRSCDQELDQKTIKAMEYENISRQGNCIKIFNDLSEKEYCDSFSEPEGRGYIFHKVVGEHKGSPVIFSEGYEYWNYAVVSPDNLTETNSLRYYSQSPKDIYKITAGYHYGSFEFTIKKHGTEFVKMHFEDELHHLPMGKLFWISEDTFILEVKFENTDRQKSSLNTGDVYYIQVNLEKDPRCSDNSGPLSCFYDMATYLQESASPDYLAGVRLVADDSYSSIKSLPKLDNYTFKEFEFDADAYGYGIFNENIQKIVFLDAFTFGRATGGFPIGITKNNYFVYFFKTEKSEYVDDPYGPAVFYPTEVDLIKYNLLTGKKNTLTTKTCSELKSYNRFKDIYCGQGEVNEVQPIENLYKEFNLNF